MKVFFYCSTCFECYYIHPQELATVCRCIVLFRCVLVYWCGLAGVFSNKIFLLQQYTALDRILSYIHIFGNKTGCHTSRKQNFILNPYAQISSKSVQQFHRLSIRTKCTYADELIGFHLKHRIQKDTETYTLSRPRLKCDGTRAETRFRLSAKRTSPFKSAERASVQSTAGSRDVRHQRQ